VRKDVRLACWNADGIRGRKLELEYFLSEHGIDIHLLSETQLEPTREALRWTNYVCHLTDRPTRGGGTAILVRRGIVRYAVSISVLQHCHCHVVLANRPVKSRGGLPITRTTLD